MDIDGGDALDMAEIKGALEVMQISVSELECAALFDRPDADKSGTIGRDEFLRFVSRDNSISEGKVGGSRNGKVCRGVSDKPQQDPRPRHPWTSQSRSQSQSQSRVRLRAEAVVRAVATARALVRPEAVVRMEAVVREVVRAVAVAAAATTLIRPCGLDSAGRVRIERE